MFKHMNNRLVVGADIGGSHITAALVDLHSGKIVEGGSFKEHVNAAAPADEIIMHWAKAISAAINASYTTIDAIGIAMPGPFDYANGISYIRGLAKYESLYGLNVRELLKKELNFSGEIYFENDASCFGMGESWSGEGMGCERIVAITLGTGLGGTFLISNEVQTSGEGVPEGGYIYNLPYKEGIAEDYISSRWLVNAFNAAAESNITEVKVINELAMEGNTVARQLFDQIGTSLGEVLAPWLSAFNAERLVIGGNIRNAHAFFLPSLKNKFQEHQINTSIYISTNGELSAIAGAAYLCKQHFVTGTTT
jgi:glucokinase